MAHKPDLATLLPLPQIINLRGGFWKLPVVLDLRRNFISNRIDSALAEMELKIRPTSQSGKSGLALLIDPDCPALAGAAPAIKPESYMLDISDGICLRAGGERGIFYGLQTLRQLLDHGRILPRAKIIDWPDMTFRGMHLTLGSGHMPSADMLAATITRAAQYKINEIVFEYDNRFPWKRHPAIPHPAALTRADIRRLIRLAEDHFIEVIPLLDSLGHAEYYLRHAKYRHLRELPERIDEMCPSNPATLAFMKDLWSEILDLHENSRFAHITGDEVFRLGGFCRRCRKYAERGQLARLYTDYYSKLARWIIDQGKIPMVWGDMLIKYPQDIANFPRDIVIMDWDYTGLDRSDWDYCPSRYAPDLKDSRRRARLFENYWVQPETAPRFTAYPFFKFFRDQGFQVIGASAASAHNYPMPAPYARFANNKRFAMTVQANHGQGLLNTFWSGTGPLELAWFGLCAGADFAWHVRDERVEQFARRFVAAFLGAPAMPNAARVMAELQKSLADTRPIGFKSAANAGRIAHSNLPGRLNQLRRRSRNNKLYLELAGLNAELADFSRRTEYLLDAGARMIFGVGRDYCLDLRPVANRNFDDCTPANARRLDLTPGRHEIHGVKIDILNPARAGHAVLALKGGVNPSGAARAAVAVGRKLDRMFLFYTGYEAVRGAVLAHMNIRYADGTSREWPIIAGTNIADWWRFPRPLEQAFVGWEGRVGESVRIFAYLAWWDNPRPGEKVDRVEFVSVGARGYVMLAGLTARVMAGKGFPRSGKSDLQRQLRAQAVTGRRLMDRMKKAYVKIMAEDDADAAIGRIAAFDYFRRWHAVLDKHMVNF